MLTFLVGGARSGKSTLAVALGSRHDGPVTFVATAEAFDDDLRARIAAHRAERPGWPTVEVPVELADAVRAAPHTAMLIVDCLTVWVGNLFHHRPTADDRVAAYDALLDALAARTARGAPTVVVSNEVGLGLHPDTSLGREYRDELGRLNQRVAAVATRSLLLVAGRALPLVDPWEALT
ncbi:MAG: bifunctional adenosylcobinamide kinase/adenosylcobinamide-phosphate guanylyltransferase [Acidimicrobiales bacterium]|nr:bifunctional adenosylcobinamide kinase/adenosylcobinamide-phosphate guanylyltransferase [Acidimicrobiales bacterium]